MQICVKTFFSSAADRARPFNGQFSLIKQFWGLIYEAEDIELNFRIIRELNYVQKMHFQSLRERIGAWKVSTWSHSVGFFSSILDCRAHLGRLKLPCLQFLLGSTYLRLDYSEMICAISFVLRNRAFHRDRFYRLTTQTIQLKFSRVSLVVYQVVQQLWKGSNPPMSKSSSLGE